VTRRMSPLGKRSRKNVILTSTAYKTKQSESLWSRVVKILEAENSKSSIETTQSQSAKAEMISSTEQAGKSHLEKTDLQAIAVTSPDQVEELREPNDSPRRPPANPYQNPRIRRLFYLLCFYFCMLELGTGISTGLSPYYLIIWAVSKSVSYLGMVMNRIVFLRRVYVFAFDLPRFCKTHAKTPPDPEKPSPEEALEVLTLMLSDSKDGGIGEFDAADLKSMKQLLKALKERASQEIAAEVGGKRSDGTEDQTKLPQEGNGVSVSEV
jgi:hypothetical protein